MRTLLLTLVAVAGAIAPVSVAQSPPLPAVLFQNVRVFDLASMIAKKRRQQGIAAPTDG